MDDILKVLRVSKHHDDTVRTAQYSTNRKYTVDDSIKLQPTVILPPTRDILDPPVFEGTQLS